MRVPPKMKNPPIIGSFIHCLFDPPQSQAIEYSQLFTVWLQKPAGRDIDRRLARAVIQ
jgi:hypothetical protein